MDNVFFLLYLFLPADLMTMVSRKDGWWFHSSCRGLNRAFDLSGHPLLLASSILPDKGTILVELHVLIAIVHQAVPAVPSFDLSAQRVLAALQRLLIVVTATTQQRHRGFTITSFHPWLHSMAYWRARGAGLSYQSLDDEPP